MRISQHNLYNQSLSFLRTYKDRETKIDCQEIVTVTLSDVISFLERKHCFSCDGNESYTSQEFYFLGLKIDQTPEVMSDIEMKKQERFSPLGFAPRPHHL